MRRRALALLGCAVALGATTLSAQSPVTITLSDRAAVLRQRIETVAQRAVIRYSQWLGPPPFKAFTIGDSPGADLVVSVRRFDSPGSMAVESQVASQLAAAWLGVVAAEDDEWRAGAVWYLQSRVVEEAFDQAFQRPGYRRDWICFFNCRVPWAFESLTLTRWSAAPPGMARVFTTLERELGWPTLQGALRATLASARHPIAVMSDATGRDLSAVFAAARSGAIIDPGIASFESAAASCATPCYRTQIFLQEKGPVPLPLTVRVRFEDGQQVDSLWNGGRDRFDYESKTPAVAAYLDPDRVWQLDRNPFNNARVTASPTNVPVWKWMARWMTWLQDAMLSQTFPV